MSRNLKIVIFFIFSLMLSGCFNQSAEVYQNKSKYYYELAEKAYLDSIKSGKDLNRTYFQLGKLYYSHGDFYLATENLAKSDLEQAHELLAICYYKSGEYTKSLSVFDRLKEPFSQEVLYYFALACEKLNLFDRAIGLYEKINAQDFVDLAKDRVNALNSTRGAAASKDFIGLFDLGRNYSAQDYPQAGALILKVDEEMVVSGDDSAVSYSHIAAKILNERGKKDFSEIEIEYDSTDEEVELEFARVIKSDGSVLMVGQKNIRDVSKYLNFPLYSNARVRIISMPEIAEGAIVEYKAIIKKHKLIDKDKFAINYFFQENEPILNCRFHLIVPKDKKINIRDANLQYASSSFNFVPIVKEDKASVGYLWEFSDINQFLPESDMVPQSWVNPLVMISRFDSWDEIYNWWWKLAKDKISANKDIKEKVKELTDGVANDYDKARRIAEFCIEKIRYVAVEYGQAGYEPHKAEDIFQNKYGDCKDQTILLVTMMRSAGLKAWPVIIGTKDLPEVPKDFPTMLFNHVICAVEIKGEVIFIDPTAETCSFQDLPEDDHDRLVLIIKEDGLVLSRTPIFKSEKNRLELDSDFKINKDESIKVKKVLSSFGQFDQAQRYWLKYTPPQLIKETIEERIQSTSIGSKLIDYKIENLDSLDKPIKLSYVFEGAHYLTKSGSARIFPAFSRVDTSIVAKDVRRFPIDLGLPRVEEMQILVEIPRNFNIKYIPDNVVSDTKWFFFENKHEIKDNTLVFKEKKINKVSVVELEDYKYFKDAMERLAKSIDQRLIIEEK